MVVVAVPASLRWGCCEPSLRYDVRLIRGIHSDRRARRIGRTVSHIGLPRERNWPGRRIRARRRCGCRCRLLGTVLGSSGRFGEAANNIGRDSVATVVTGLATLRDNWLVKKLYEASRRELSLLHQIAK